MTKFRIQGIGLDTTSINYNVDRVGSNDTYRYVRTSIESNNDFQIANLIKNLTSNPPLLTTVGFLDDIRSVIYDHLKVVGRSSIDVLLIKSTADWKTYFDCVDFLLEGKTIKHIGLDYPESLEDLKEKIKIAGEYKRKIEFVLMPINPFNFDLELINYCIDNKIYIIGVEPFGNYINANRNILTFSVPYLLGFNANYSDISLVGSEDLIKSSEYREYLSSLVGKESSIEYTLKKTTKRAIKELKKAVYTSVKLSGENLIIPYEDPNQILMSEDLAIKIGSYDKSLVPGNIKVVDENIKSEKLVDDLNEYLKIIYFPKDGSKADRFAVSRYKVLNYLNCIYPSVDGWRIELVKVGNSLLMISVIKDPVLKGYLFWKSIVPGEVKQFYLVVPEEKEEDILFREVLVSDKESEIEESSHVGD